MMTVLFRRSALLLLGTLLAVPIITLPGGLHLLLLIACVYLLGRNVLQPGVWPLAALSIYTLLIGAVYVSSLDDWKEINSAQMRQLSVMLLAFFAMRHATLRELHIFFAAVLFVAAVGVAGEMRGIDMHGFLPAKAAQQEYYTDAGFLNDGSQRFRGFFTESSILLASTTGFAVITALGALASWRHSPGRGFLAATAGLAGLLMLFLLGVTLAKTGLVLAVGGGFGWMLAVVRYAPPRKTVRLLACAVAAAILAGGAFLLLPSSKQEYFINDVRSLPSALEGNSKLEATSSGGLLTRVECWRIAAEAVGRHPLGVGLYGIPDVVGDSNHINLTAELRYLFGLGIYGLKNTLANILAQTGLPGLTLLLLGLWQLFLQPLRVAAQHGEPLGSGPSSVYLAGFFMSLLFLATCETYYWMAFPVVLKCYGDSVAREHLAAEYAAQEDDDSGTAEEAETLATPALLPT